MYNEDIANSALEQKVIGVEVSNEPTCILFYICERDVYWSPSAAEGKTVSTTARSLLYEPRPIGRHSEPRKANRAAGGQ